MRRCIYPGLLLLLTSFCHAQDPVSFNRNDRAKQIDVSIGGQFFASLIYPDSLPKPVLFPVTTSNGTRITRGFPITPMPGDPTDHPHHIGLWLTYENVNGIDFWNNSSAIPDSQLWHYGSIRTDSIMSVKGGDTGVITYHANWVDHSKRKLLEELTTFRFSGRGSLRIIDRLTRLTAATDVTLNDAKDGLLGIRVIPQLQLPDTAQRTYKDAHGNVTVVKKPAAIHPTGNYLTSEGKTGNDAWGSRASWCKLFGKVDQDSVAIVIIDHPGNPNYPTFWHARDYGLFAANPLGEKIFTNGKSKLDLQLKAGSSAVFLFRIVITDGQRTPAPAVIAAMAADFATRQFSW
jgi:hypothetical protein